jgi:hypothetical protein
MARKPDGSDREIPPDEIEDLDPATLRALFESGDAAMFDAETRARIGRFIARGAQAPPPPPTVAQPQQQQQQRAEPDPGEDTGTDTDTDTDKP